MPGLSNYRTKEASNQEMSNETKPPTIIDNIFKLQFMNDAEMEIYKDSANEYKHTHNMSASEKVSYEMSMLPMLDLSQDGSVNKDIKSIINASNSTDSELAKHRRTPSVSSQ